MAGRGAWNSKGRGGTLKRKAATTEPGAYYLLAVAPDLLVGAAARNALRAGTPPTLDDLAVHLGVKAIQKLLNLADYTGKVPLVEDGVFGKGTDTAVRAFQADRKLTVDGSVGRNTIRPLLLPHIKRIGTAADAGGQPWWTVVYGMLANEGGWDPGAVGSIDENDLGLAQINGLAHPKYSVAQRFDPITAIQFNIDYLKKALGELDGNLRDAVLSYNLGPWGIVLWIRAGRPRYWNPKTRTTSPVANVAGGFRDTMEYVDRILDAYEEQ